MLSELGDNLNSDDENYDSGFEREPSDIINITNDNEGENLNTASEVTTNANIRDAYLNMLCLPVGSTLVTPKPIYDPSLLLESTDAMAPAVARASESVAGELYKHVK